MFQILSWIILLQTVLMTGTIFWNSTLAIPLNCSYHLGSCHLKLRKVDLHIDQQLLNACNVDCTSLSVFSSDSITHTIAQDAFQKFTSLSHLSLRLNLATAIDFDWISQLKNIETLDLTHCNIRNLYTYKHFDGLKNVVMVNFSHNDLIYLPYGLTSLMPELRTIDISYNNFANFPDISSNNLTVDITNNPLLCTCANVKFASQVTFVTSNFTCNLSACPQFLTFHATLSESVVSVAGELKIYCEANASNPVQFDILSPIGLIPGPSLLSGKTVSYTYVFLPVRRPINLVVRQSSNMSMELTIDYVRGHHAGIWRCGASLGGTYILNDQITTVIVRTEIDDLFLSTTILGFIAMGATLILGLIIGTIRYMIETRCFSRPQSHKYVARPLIGVIPVPSLQTQGPASVEDISLNRRICSSCLTQPCFTCGYCFGVHKFSAFEVYSDNDALNTRHAALCKREKYTSICVVEASVLLKSDCSPTTERRSVTNVQCILKSTGDEMNTLPEEGTSDPDLDSSITLIPHANVSNYDFPSEFCHCNHFDMRSASQRDVKLIFRDEQLAREYTEALQALQAAANSYDAATFRDRLEEFRGKLVHDVGAGVRVARDEIVALKEKSVKSVARLKDQGGVVAQRMRAGLSQVKDGMRSVAEMCTGISNSPVGIEAIGQSISVVSLYKDENTRKTKERCVSNFKF